MFLICYLCSSRCNLFNLCISAVEFLRNAKQGKYDAIIVDSSDPVGKFLNYTDRRFKRNGAITLQATCISLRITNTTLSRGV